MKYPTRVTRLARLFLVTIVNLGMAFAPMNGLQIQAQQAVTQSVVSTTQLVSEPSKAAVLQETPAPTAETTEVPTTPEPSTSPEPTDETPAPVASSTPEESATPVVTATVEPTQAPTDEVPAPTASATPEVTASVEPTQAPTDETPAPTVSVTPEASATPEISLPHVQQTFCQLDISDLGDMDPFTFHFAAVNTAGIDSYSWDFGDSQTAGNVQSVDHTYAANGTYTVTLNCNLTAGGSPFVLVGTINVQTIPVADFVVNPGQVITGLAPYNISTTNVSTGSNLTYNWVINTDINPATAPIISTSTNQNINFTLPTYNTVYWLHLTVTDHAGSTATADKSVVLQAPAPLAKINVSPTDGTTPLLVTVTGVDENTGPIDTWTWSYGDGSPTDSGQGPFTHTYTLADPLVAQVFTITLTYSGPGGGGTASQQIGVYPDTQPVQSIFVQQSLSNVAGGIEVCFQNNSTGPVVTSSWDFEGDGTYDLDDASAIVCHTYATEGLRTVRLRVRDLTGTATSTSSLVVNVTAAPIANFTINPGSSITQFTPISLDSSSSTGTIVTYAWDFNDDGTTDSTTANPSNIQLLQLGNNKIRLTVTGPGGTSFVEKIVYVARLEITCNFTGKLTVLPSDGTEPYTSVLGNVNGRTVTYQWQVTSSSLAVPLTFSTQNIAINWAAQAEGSYQITLTATTADGSTCDTSKTVTRAWKPLNCNLSDSLPSPLYADGNTYQFTANVANLDGRSVVGYQWSVDGVDQGVSGSTFSRSWSSTVGLPKTETIRYDVTVDNGGGNTVTCHEEKVITVSQWPALTCNNIAGNGSPIPALPDNLTRNYQYTANISGLAGRTNVAYNWIYTPANLISQSGNSINLSYPPQFSALAPGQAQNMSVQVTVTNPDGTTDTCNMNKGVSVSVPRLQCGLPSGDITPVVGETNNYTPNISQDYGRPITTLDWELQQNDGSGNWTTVATGSGSPFGYLFNLAGTQYRVRYAAAVTYSAGAANLDDNCVSNWQLLDVTGAGENFFCDAFPAAGNNFAPISASTSYAYTVDIDNGNAIPLFYRYVLVGPGATERQLGTFTSSGDNLVTGPGFLGSAFGPVDNYTLRIDVSALNNTDSSAPGYSAYTCSYSHALIVGALTVQYTYDNGASGAVNANAVEVGTQVCFTNTSSTSHNDINGMTYAWNFGTANTSLGQTSTQTQPGCLVFTQPSGAGGYSVNLQGTALDLNGQPNARTANYAVIFHVYGSQSIAINRSQATFAPSTINFQAVGINITGGYQWKFYVKGNPTAFSTKNGQNVSQFFNSPGIYVAEVSGIGPLGTTTASVEFTLIDLSQLRAAFRPSVYAGVALLSVCFTDESEGTGIEQWDWDFGNGQTLTYTPATKPATICTTYPASGLYAVNLTIRKGTLVETASNPIRVYTLLESSATFTIAPQGAARYCFTPILVGNVSVTGWDYGDGVTAGALPNPCHTYSATGTYLVSMLIRNNDTGEPGTVVRPVTVTLTTPPTPSLAVTSACSGDGTATFHVSNTGADMTSADQVIIRNSAGVIIKIDSVQLAHNQSQDFIVTGQYGTVSFSTVDTGLSASANCPNPPDLKVSAVCSLSALPVFTVVNDRPTAPMLQSQSYTIKDSAGTVIASGTFTLTTVQTSIDIPVPAGNTPYDQYLFESNGVYATLSLAHRCGTQPTLTVTGTCSSPITFTITNISANDMVVSQDFVIVNGSSQDVTPATNTFQLKAGESTTITLTGLDPYAGYTLNTTGFAGTVSKTQDCQRPVLTIESQCAYPIVFTVTNSGGDMLEPQAYVVVNGSAQTVLTGNLSLKSGESTNITLTGLDPYAGYTLSTAGFAGTVSKTQDCQRPVLTIESQCAYPIVFTVTNSGGDMLEPQAYVVVNGSAQTVLTGNLSLKNGESTNITLTGLDPYAGYTLSTEGFAGTVSKTQDCQRPVIVVQSQCVYPIAFTVTNNGGDMLLPQAYTIVNGGGQTVAEGNLNLKNGENITFTLTNLDPYAGYTFNTTGFAGTVSKAQNCQRPDLRATWVCADPLLVVLTNAGGPMLLSQDLSVEDNAQNIVFNATFLLGSGETTQYSLNNLLIYERYTLKTGTWAGTISLSHQCAAPQLAVAAICTSATTTTFVISNAGSDMLSSQAFSVTTSTGDDVTPTPNTFKLAHGEQITVPITSSATGLILTTSGKAGAVSATATCAEQRTPATAIPVGFQGLSGDLDKLPPWASVPSCGHGCPTFRLYHTNETGDWEIFRLDGADAQKQETLRKNLSNGKGASDMSPSLSPNNAWIVFTSNRDTQPGAAENWELYVAPTGGDESQVRRVTYNTYALDTNPVWGPHQYVAFQSTRDGNWEIYLMDMETGVEYRVTDDAASDIHPAWSPDGSKLAFQSARDGKWQIYVLDLATRSLSRLSDGTRIEVDPQFSPDGQRLAFRSYAAEGTESTLYIRDLGSNQSYPITSAGVDATNQAWSPSGSKIAYQALHDGQLDVFVYELASRGTRNITDSTIRSYAPTWLCDDNTVVFTSDADGQPDIFQTPSLPISAPSIDVAKEADRMTFEPSDDIYPEGAPQKEFASREGRTNTGDYGTQTEFLNPDVSTSDVDITRDDLSKRDWKLVESCPVTSVSARP